MKNQDMIVKQMQSVYKSGTFEHHRTESFKKFGHLMHKDAVNYLLQKFKDEDCIRIIDIGCAYGNDYEIFKTILENEGFSGKIQYYGCDITPELVEEATNKNITAFEGNFQDENIKMQLGKGHLVWANLSIIHFQPEELPEAISDLCFYCQQNGLLSIGIKVGNDYHFIDPPDDKVPVERPTTLFNISTIKYELKKNNFTWISVVEKQKPDLKDDFYHYAWILALKKMGN